VRWELTESKKRLEDKLGREMVGFAYPYGSGAYKPEVRRAALDAGLPLSTSRSSRASRNSPGTRGRGRQAAFDPRRRQICSIFI